MICESKSLKGKTFAQISPLLIEKYKKERRESELEKRKDSKALNHKPRAADNLQDLLTRDQVWSHRQESVRGGLAVTGEQ